MQEVLHRLLLIACFLEVTWSNMHVQCLEHLAVSTAGVCVPRGVKEQQVMLGCSAFFFAKLGGDWGCRRRLFTDPSWWQATPPPCFWDDYCGLSPPPLEPESQHPAPAWASQDVAAKAVLQMICVPLTLLSPHQSSWTIISDFESLCLSWSPCHVVSCLPKAWVLFSFITHSQVYQSHHGFFSLSLFFFCYTQLYGGFLVLFGG